MFKPTREYWIEHGCIHCRNRNGRQCMLNTCNLEKNSFVNKNIIKDMVESEFDCITCPYKKHGGCFGYCLRQVLTECSEVWKKNEKWRQKNG